MSWLRRIGSVVLRASHHSENPAQVVDALELGAPSHAASTRPGPFVGGGSSRRRDERGATGPISPKTSVLPFDRFMAQDPNASFTASATSSGVTSWTGA